MLPDDEENLRWYFTEARGDCGVRSTFGYQLEMARRGVFPGKHERSLPEAPMDLVGWDGIEAIVEHMEPTIRRMAPGDKANKISKRLARCTELSQVVLELQYGAERHLGTSGVSLGLACWTPTSKRGYEAARKAFDATATMRAKLRHGSKRETKTHKDSARGRALATSRMWLLWISMQAQKRGGEAAETILEKVLAEAKSALNAAHVDYEKACAVCRAEEREESARREANRSRAGE